MASTLSSAAEGATGAAAAHVAAGPWRYAAFLSYSHSDKRAAARLHDFLESYRIPRDLVGRETARGIVPERLRPIFRDREDLAAADDLSREIDTALGESRALIVLCSPHAAVSRWTNIEIERFRQLHGDTGIFAAIIAGEPFASDHPARAADECFPPALRQRPTPDGPVRAEPVGADLRREADGEHAGRLKLVAGMLGVPLDELVHRDARRRHRRTLALVVALLVGLALTSALALFALQARNEAVRQRAEAEGLIEFMVTDLRRKLEPMGRLGAMDTLGDRALAFYQRQDVASLDPDSLGRRARVVRLIGEIQDQRGNLDTALDNFETAAATTAELLARSPDNPDRIFDHAQSVFWVGYIAYRRGNFERAETAFQTYLKLAQRLVAQAPGNLGYRAELGYAQSNLATLRYAEGQNAIAAELFESALAISRELAADTPDEESAQLDYAQSLAWLADSKERLGALDTAAAERTQEAAILDAMLRRNGENRSAQLALVTSRRAQSRIALARGDTAAAIRHGTGAVALSRELTQADPANADWMAAAAATLLQLGDAELAAGHVDAARAALIAAAQPLSKLNARDRSVAKWQMLRVREQLLRAGIFARDGAPAQSLAVANAALTALGALTAAGRDESEVRWLRSRALLLAANARQALGDTAGAAHDFAVVARIRTPAGTTEEPRIATLRAEAAAAQRHTMK
ncbi:toll/interleukin-1 receptor domain-containing protein [Polymorphobacter arshaanensis]|uniref:toll/interleukin-1 receptor domain-containing protein n=1 Tax=Glacieibacterium arshaanense TaxID=2511025 RepID=UPI0014084F30|nr:toll/interleukin-1 receptor domain-containing protein [Polymorphobacter arshaanensis]